MRRDAYRYAAPLKKAHDDSPMLPATGYPSCVLVLLPGVESLYGGLHAHHRHVGATGCNDRKGRAQQVVRLRCPVLHSGGHEAHPTVLRRILFWLFAVSIYHANKIVWPYSFLRIDPYDNTLLRTRISKNTLSDIQCSFKSINIIFFL
jgi:hypothetical protein